ncbi:MAG: hypothetical protein L3J99_00920 [Thermoplasmata archaeon]|nr:hypothetical protein [Thermoplasmata archaeon]
MRTRSRTTVESWRRRTLGTLFLALLAGFPIVPMIPGPGGPSVAGARGDRPVALARTEPALLGGFGLTVQISLPGPSVDPNAPFTLEATAQGGFGWAYRYLWNDSLGLVSTNRSITLLAPGSGSVWASVSVRDELGNSAQASASVGIGSAPSIALASFVGATDVGLPIPLSIRVDGSFPPFAVTWTPLPDGSARSSVLQAAGQLEVATTQASPGYAWIQASVTDRLSVSATVDGIVAVVHPRPQVLLTAAQPAVDAGARAVVTGLVVGGTPPFSWAAAASLPDFNVTGATGTVGTSAPINWSGRFAGVGNATVRFDLSDAAGTLLSADTSLRVYPPLELALAVETRSPQAGAPLNLSVDLVGGMAPYSYSMVLSDEERSAGSVDASGPFLWVAHPAAPGFLSVHLRVEDSLSGTTELVSTVVVAAFSASPSPPDPPLGPPPTAAPVPKASPPPSQGALGYLGLLVLIVAASGAFLWERRRRRPRNGPLAPSVAPAEETLRRLLRDSDGTEPSVLRVLAEEEGLSGGEVDSALASLQASGRVRVERSEDGSELIRWVGPGPTEPALSKDDP